VSATICSGFAYSFYGQMLGSAGSYRDTLTGAAGCDSIIVLTLTVTSSPLTVVAQNICSGSTYSFGGQSLSASGTYHDTLTSAGGCDSIVTLTLAVNTVDSTPISKSICSGSVYNFYGHNLSTAGTYRDTLTTVSGCDSVIVLTLSVVSSLTIPVSQTICSGATYTFYGQTLSSAGTYRDTMTSAAGCDSITVLTLNVVPSSTTPVSATICSGFAYSFYGQMLGSAGSYRDTLTGAAGCDSIIVLTLNVVSSITTPVSQGICTGSTYTFNGQALSTAGTYYDTLTSVAGCDSVVVLTLTVIPVSSTPVSQSICSGSSYNFYGQNLTTSGTYSDTLTSAEGCDSIIVLTLSVVSSITNPISASSCTGSYIFNGQTLTTSGTYSDTLPSVAGCDSITVLTLTVGSPSSLAISQTICNNSTYPFNGQNLNTTGTYAETLTNVSGCDSTITLTLTVVPTSTTALSQSICSGSTYNFNGQTLTTAGTYIDTLANVSGCDSIIILALTIVSTSTTQISQSLCSGTSYTFNGLVLSTAGVYTDTLTGAAGCDSIIVLTLTIIPTSSSAISQTICGGVYTFGTQALTTSGTYVDTFTNAAGCDSIMALTLTVLQPSTDSTNAGICGDRSYTFHGQTLTAAGIYRDTFTNAAGCDSFSILNLVIAPQPASSFLISPSGIVSLGSAVTVTDESTNADSILWQLNTKVISLVSGGALPIQDTGTYCLRQIASTSLGCSDTSQECITVYNNSFYLPNAFTPNNDGVNDYISLYGYTQSMKYLSITVYDRWGEKVFESNDINFQWDGTYRGVKEAPGIYVYTLNITFLSGASIANKGSITLIR
jgi:gliding motility-associated-like protein